MAERDGNTGRIVEIKGVVLDVVFPDRLPEILTALLDLVAAGRLHPLIERQYAFADAGDALAHVEAGHTVGKVVVRVAE